MPADHRDQATEILNFWFIECKPWQWFRRDDARDAHLRCRFGALTETAQSGGLQHWENHSESALGLVLLLDQFSRQIWRDEARAFHGDERAQQLSDLALRKGWLQQERLKARRQFWLMPQLHAESLMRVERVIPLMEEWVDEATADVARRNRECLLRHGRYPWRDATLGRWVETNA